MAKRRALIIAGGVLGVALIGYAGFVLLIAPTASTDEASEPALETATVARGDIVMTVSGSGELVPASEVDLSFRAGGIVDEVLVDRGDHVQQGQLLASLQLDRLELALFEAEIDLQVAQMELEELQEGSNQDALADAQAALRDAQVELELAQDSYDRSINSNLDAAISSRQADYDWWQGYYQHQKGLYEAGNLSQEDHDWALLALIAAEGRLRAATNAAENEEIQAESRLSQAQAGVDQAWADLLQAQSEPCEDTLQKAALDLDKAKLAYDEAAADLAAARLAAPFDGVVMDVSITPGEQAGSNAPAITLGALAEPMVLFWVEEADLASMAADQRVSVTFESWPDYVFDGEIVLVYAKLVQVGMTTAVQAWATVVGPEDVGQEVQLLSGMTAEVEVIAAEATDVLLVPLEALHEESPDEYFVYVVGAGGELERRPVVVGMLGYTNAEIVDGVELREVVAVGDIG